MIGYCWEKLNSEARVYQWASNVIRKSRVRAGLWGHGHVSICTGRETGDLQPHSKRPSRRDATIKWQGNVGTSEKTNSKHGHSSFASIAVVKKPAQQPAGERVHWAEITGHSPSLVRSSIKILGFHVSGQEQREKKLVDPCCLRPLHLHTPEHKGAPTLRMCLLPQIMKQSLTENDPHRYDLDNASVLLLSGGSRS